MLKSLQKKEGEYTLKHQLHFRVVLLFIQQKLEEIFSAHVKDQIIEKFLNEECHFFDKEDARLILSKLGWLGSSERREVHHIINQGLSPAELMTKISNAKEGGIKIVKETLESIMLGIGAHEDSPADDESWIF